MFTDVELNYIKSIVNTYKKHGYKYYLCHTVTERYNDYDATIYLSKEPIKASTENTFVLNNALVINIDSSSRNDTNDTSISYRTLLHNSNYSGSISVNIAEFIYTNAECIYELTSFVKQPDIMNSGVTNPDNMIINYSSVFLVLSIFLYLFIKSVLRIKV